MACDYIEKLDESARLRYQEKLTASGLTGCPYKLPAGKWVNDPTRWPAVQWPDVYSYLIDTPDYASTPTEPTSRDTSTPASPATDLDHPAPEPSPARYSQFGTSPSTLSRTGKRKRSNTKQDLSTIFALMQEAEREQHREQMELQREHQREQRELQRQQLELNSLLVDEVRQSREAEVAVRREEIAQNAALNNTLMAVFETLARRVGPVFPTIIMYILYINQ
ncbi:uncharacterized protein KZ484_016301 [Pholidichthys leucotaenia]